MNVLKHKPHQQERFRFVGGVCVRTSLSPKRSTTIKYKSQLSIKIIQLPLSQEILQVKQKVGL
jgi:hypothetical protein